MAISNQFGTAEPDSASSVARRLELPPQQVNYHLRELETEIRFANAAERANFAEELTAAVMRLAAKYNSDGPGSRAFHFVMGAYPALTKTEEKVN